MKELLTRVCDATGLDETAALPAIGHVLQFIRDHAPASYVAELTDKIPDANQAIAAAAAASDAGVTAAIGMVKGLFGFGQTDMNILSGKLGNLGLSEKQAQALLKEVFAYAESLVGKEGVAKMTAAMPYLSGFIAKISSPEAPGRGV
ncbi:MAG: hypothetical protein ACR652_12520 [Methylocystis sp.]|uniref:hypothetical protein n=1 Tax=Methylocystis sp. TaxID=1911079 RepID=UPI003DA32799